MRNASKARCAPAQSTTNRPGAADSLRLVLEFIFPCASCSLALRESTHHNQSSLRCRIAGSHSEVWLLSGAELPRGDVGLFAGSCAAQPIAIALQAGHAKLLFVRVELLMEDAILFGGTCATQPIAIVLQAGWF